jgi:hypothetical protein
MISSAKIALMTPRNIAAQGFSTVANLHHSKLTSFTSHIQKRSYETYKRPPETKLIEASPLISIDDFEDKDLHPEIEATHPIQIGYKDGCKFFIKNVGENKRFPLSEQYPGDIKMQTLEAEFRARKEVFYTNLVLAVLGQGRAPETSVVVDDLDKPKEFYVASKELTGFHSLYDIIGRKGTHEVFSVNKQGQTCIEFEYIDPETQILMKVNKPINGRIALKHISNFIGDSDDNQRNAGVRFIPGKGYMICVIDCGCGGGLSLNYAPEDIAFAAPEGIYKTLVLPENIYEKIKLRYASKQWIFDRIAGIDPKKLGEIFNASFPPHLQNVFEKRIEEMKSNTLDARDKYAGAAKLNFMAYQSKVADLTM